MVPTKIALSQSELDSKQVLLSELNRMLFRAGIPAPVVYSGPDAPMYYFMGYVPGSDVVLPWNYPSDATVGEFIEAYRVASRS